MSFTSKALRAVTLAAALTLLAGCQTTLVKTGQGATPSDTLVYHKSKGYFLGFIGKRRVDTAPLCDNGNMLIHERTRFGDGILSMLTAGLFGFRTVSIYCHSETAISVSAPLKRQPAVPPPSPETR